MSTLLLITADPSHPLANHAYRYAKAFLATNKETVDANLQLFFYADAAHTANGLRWQVADKDNLTKQWQQLAQDHGIRLPVCVSTAITRGVSDDDNAKRHQLPSNNLATGFELVGLGEMAAQLNNAESVLQF